MDKTFGQIARDALAALDRDGWCQGTTTWDASADEFAVTDRERYPLGSHCLGGLLNIGICGVPAFFPEHKEYYRRVERTIREMYGWEFDNPEFEVIPDDHPFSFLNHTRYIAMWNDRVAEETDVRAVLEKIAAED